MEIAPTEKRTSSVVVLGRERAESEDVRYGNRTYAETNTIGSGGFHTAGRA